MKKSEKTRIREYVLRQYEYVNGRCVRIQADGSVTVQVDAMPNINIPGRIFVGWDTEIGKKAAAAK